MKAWAAFFVVFCLLSAACADGAYFDQSMQGLEEPRQGAIVIWDGETETILLSSAVSWEEEPSSLVWLVPVVSSTKPDVTSGDIDVFKILVSYLAEETRISAHWEEVSELQDVYLYDIKTLKAEDSHTLLDWLNSEGYTVPESIRSFFDEYTSKGNVYFIGNNLDLAKRYGWNYTDSLVRKIEERRKSFNKTYLPLERSEVTSTSVKWAADHITSSIIEGRPFPSDIVNGIWRCDGVGFVGTGSNQLISREDYERLLSEGSLVDNQNLSCITHRACRILSGVGRGLIEGPVLLYCEDSQTGTYFGLCDGETKTEREVRSTPYISEMGYCISFVQKAGSLEAARSALRDLCSADKVKEKYDQIGPQVEKIIKEEVMGGGNLSQFERVDEETKNMREVRAALRKGLTKPLRIEFKPTTPFYPLEISSLGKGHSRIEVYVIAPWPVYDNNGMLDAKKSKKVSTQLKSELAEKNVTGEGLNYVTKFSYNGPLSKLRADAEFEKTDDLKRIGEELKQASVSAIDSLRNVVFSGLVSLMRLFDWR